MKYLLINHTNKSYKHWSDKQKKGYDKVLNFLQTLDVDELSDSQLSDLVDQNFKLIEDLVEQNRGYNVHLAVDGDLAYCLLMLDRTKEYYLTTGKLIDIVVPTYKDGQFRKWRNVTLYCNNYTEDDFYGE